MLMLPVITKELQRKLVNVDSTFLPLGVYNGPDRTGLAVDVQAGPNIVACCCVNGRGLSMFDLRMPIPMDFIYDVSYKISRKGMAKFNNKTLECMTLS